MFGRALLLVLMAAPMAGALGVKSKSPQGLLEHYDDLYRGSSSHAIAEMAVTTANYSRTLKLEVWSKGARNSLVRILAPTKEQGTATLMAGNNIWNFLPKVNRVVKIPQTMMGGAWMGAHLTNDDLVKLSRLSADYTFAQTFAGKRGAEQVTELTLTPRKDAPVVWSKMVIEFRDQDQLPISARFENERGQLVRTFHFENVKKLGGRLVPATIRVVPADKPTESTQFTYLDLKFDVPLEDDYFSLRTLQK